MAKTKQQKEEIVKKITDRLSGAASVIFVNFDGLNVQETTELRSILREEGIEYTVAKRTLLQLALEKADLKGIDISALPGGLGAAFGKEDEVLPAKLLYTFGKKHEALKLIGGIYQDKFIGAEEALALAQLPGKEELKAKLVWLVNYPVSGFVNVLAGSMRQLVYALQAIKESKS